MIIDPRNNIHIMFASLFCSCTAEETYAKLLNKLARFSGNNNHQGYITLGHTV